MAMTSQNLTFLLDEIVSALAFESFYEEPFMMPVLYDVRGSSRRRERSASMGGLTTWQEKQPNQAPAEDTMQQQFSKDFVHTPFGKQVPVERELIDDQEFDTLLELAQEIGVTASLTMEQKAGDLWNDLIDGDSYKAEDGLSVCNNAHLNAQGTNSQDNLLANSLDFAGVEATRLAMRKFTNYRGDKLSVRGRLLVVPIDLEQTAWEIVKSIGKPDTSDNNLNFYNGMFDMIAWDYLEDTDDWFMVDPRMMKRNLIWYQRVGMEIFGDGDLFVGTRRVGGYMRFSQGVKDWRWIIANRPA